MNRGAHVSGPFARCFDRTYGAACPPFPNSKLLGLIAGGAWRVVAEWRPLRSGPSFLSRRPRGVPVQGAAVFWSSAAIGSCRPLMSFSPLSLCDRE